MIYFSQKLSDENAKLTELLEQKSNEVTSLNDRIAKLTNSIDSLTIECSSVSTAKVVELSKKNRHLTAELNAVKSKCKSIGESQQNLQKLLTEKDEQLKQNETASIDEHPLPSEIQILTDKLDRSNKKVFEILNQNTQLKNELKMSQKCLQQEIGDNVNVTQLMSSTSNWRGRAQQIQMLHSKVTDLKGKLEMTSFDSYDETASLPLKRLDSLRRLEIDTLNRDLNECKSQLDDLKQKNVALKIRNKNLSDDSNSYKLKTLDLLEKSARDEEFIKCLNEQILMMKFECNHKTEEMKKEVERVEQKKQNSDNEIEQLQCQIQNQDELLAEKNDEITKLKITIDNLEINLRDISHDFLFSCRQMSKDDYVTLLKNLEKEKNDLLSFMQQLNERLDKESMRVSEQHDTIHKQRLKISRLEAKLRELEAEKEATKAKNRRAMRINEYSRKNSHESINSNRSSEQQTNEIDKYKFK